VRKIDPASVDFAGPVKQLKEGEQERWDRRSARFAADQAKFLAGRFVLIVSKTPLASLLSSHGDSCASHKADKVIAEAGARNTTLPAERAAEVLTWGADEHALCTAATVWWLYCRDKPTDLRVTSNHLLITTIAAAVLPRLMKPQPCIPNNRGTPPDISNQVTFVRSHKAVVVCQILVNHVR
jgi:hypothetical protein